MSTIEPTLGAPARAVVRDGVPRLAAAVVGLVAMIDAAGGWLYAQTPDDNLALVAVLAAATLVPAAIGLLVVRTHRRHPVGRLLLAHAVGVAVVLNADAYAEYAGIVRPGVLPGAALVGHLNAAAWPLLYVCLALTAFVFPDGRFLSARWRRFTVLCLGGYLLLMVAIALTGNELQGRLAPLESPLPILPEAVVGPLGMLGLLAVPVSLVGAAIGARQRFRRASGDDRLKMLWFATAAVTLPAALLLCWTDYMVTGSAGTLTFLGVTIVGSAMPVGIGIGILRHQLFDIEVVLSRALVYGTLTMLVVGVYAGVLLGLGSLLDNRSVSGLVAVGLVAVAIQPVHARLRRRVERWVYGDRSDPYAALRRLSERVAATPDPEAAIAVVTASIAEALRVERVTVELARQASPFDGRAPSVPARVRVPLEHRGTRLGDLVVDVPRGRQLSAPDLTLLDDLARHAAVVVDAIHLTLDLQQSRARLVTAREEERRRLRRDLHDGVGPMLAAIVLKLNVLGATADDPSSTELIGELREEAKGAIGEIRRLVDDLRPPALDEVGLVGALRQKADSLSAHGTDHPLVVEVDAPEPLPPLTAAAEVAAYRIAMEAITNVVRHAHATRCVVSVSAGAALEVVVTDNGTGPGDTRRSGVGWTSMRERAAELGGHCVVRPRPEGGTVVHATIPLGASFARPREAPVVQQVLP